jgi:hypothetical protein
MVIDLLGVIEDGSSPGEGVPSNTRKTLLIPRGSDVIIRLRIKRRSGVPFIPPVVDASNKAELFIKQRSDLDTLLMLSGAVLVGDDSPGYSFTATAAQIQNLDQVGKGIRLVYDVKLTAVSKVDYVVPLSTMVIGATA